MKFDWALEHLAKVIRRQYGGGKKKMGYYIQVPENLNKAAQLVELHNGEIVPQPESFDAVPEGFGLVCVVQNAGFDAAAYCYSAREFEGFCRDDGRMKHWVLMDGALAAQLSGYVR